MSSAYHRQRAREANLKHGLSGTPTYRSWLAMTCRCRETNNYYFKKGIKVCARWADFEVFRGDMGDRPEGTSLDRIDPTGNYEPSNCRWATKSVQANNRTDCRYLLFKGQTLTVAQWARELGMGEETIRNRLARGLPVDRVLGDPVKRCGPVRRVEVRLR